MISAELNNKSEKTLPHNRVPFLNFLFMFGVTNGTTLDKALHLRKRNKEAIVAILQALGRT